MFWKDDWDTARRNLSRTFLGAKPPDSSRATSDPGASGLSSTPARACRPLAFGWTKSSRCSTPSADAGCSFWGPTPRARQRRVRPSSGSRSIADPCQ